VVPVLDDIGNFFMNLKFNKNVPDCSNIKSLLSTDVLPNIWLYSKSYPFSVVVGSADKGPRSIDKLSNLADSRRYLRNALPPYAVDRCRCTSTDTFLFAVNSAICLSPSMCVITSKR
jgi:hypothetical protein